MPGAASFKRLLGASVKWSILLPSDLVEAKEAKKEHRTLRRYALLIVSLHAPEGKPSKQYEAQVAPAHDEEGKPPRRIPVRSKTEPEADS